MSLVAGLLISPSLVAWMSPTIAGLILAILISWASGQRSIGLALKKLGLLVTPEETNVPPIAARANALSQSLAESRFDDADGLLALHADPILREAHEAFLPEAPPRVRGQVTAERAMAEAKLNDARTIQEASLWLLGKERMTLLHDRALLGVLARLPAD